MNATLRVSKLLSLLFASVCLSAIAAEGQAHGPHGKNNPYSPSPGGRVKPEAPQAQAPVVKPDPNAAAFIMQPTAEQSGDDRPTIAQRTYKLVKAADMRAVPPSQIYKVGVGDVLFINLKNALQGSGYHTVRQDGTIDFPLAGEDLVVADQTIDAIEEILASRIKLFPDPQVEVKVREFGSHKVTVSGLVDNPGEKSLQREAIPLYVIKAQASVSTKATKAVITRAPLLKLETYELRDATTDNVLIYPGNSVEFASDGTSMSNAGVFFISGGVASAGQKDLVNGMTLYQAIAASGGAKGGAKKAVIRRKNDSGLFTVYSHDLRAIKDGKAADPPIVSGDVIEIRN